MAGENMGDLGRPKKQEQKAEQMKKDGEEITDSLHLRASGC